MKLLLTALNKLASQKDLLLVAVFVTILLMMIIPLPPIVMDVMITLNVSIAIMIMLMSLHLHNPVHFSTFPSLLLVTTLFRLAISISTTRLILIEGDAGRIVETFGNVVVGGNLVVGLVIFLIITVVQFLVITKGADRVAEVGARFTLDGLPGKQMSVDADVRAGSIDQATAKKQRELLERETKLFGAMDGAMKFVKGDAIAGLVITAINLIGGVAIGMSQFGLGFSEALGLYAILTIGDGLVAQIPALLISVSAGTMVTRVTNPKGIDLGSEIAEQITANHRTLKVAGIVIAGFGLIPGFPTLIFFMVGFGIAGGIHFYQKYAESDDDEALKSWKEVYERHEEECQEIMDQTGTTRQVHLILPKSVTETDPASFLQDFVSTRDNLDAVFGIPMGIWSFEISETEDVRYHTFINGELVTSADTNPDAVFVRGNPAFLDAVDIPYDEHFGARDAVFVKNEYIPKLEEEKIHFWTFRDLIVFSVKRTVGVNLELFVGLQATNRILREVERANPDLISDLRDTLTNQQISLTLKSLVQERIPIGNKVRILESILEWAPKRPDPQHILQNLRAEIGDFITRWFATDGFLPAIVVSPSLESIIREGFRSASDQSYLVIDSHISESIIDQVQVFAKEPFKRGTDPVIVTQQDIRRALYNLLTEHGIYIPVVSYQEITPTTVVYSVDFITPEGRKRDAIDEEPEEVVAA